MRSFQCECGRYHMLPNVILCPFCLRDMMSNSDEHSRKHVKRCALSISPPKLTGGRPGRPSERERRRVAEAEFERHCRNCGTPFCQGCEDGVCDRWSCGALERCPFCGMRPVLVDTDGMCAVICDNCSVRMSGADRDALVLRWNRKGNV